MKYLITAMFFLSLSAPIANAQLDETSVEAQIQALQAQVKELQAKINTLLGTTPSPVKVTTNGTNKNKLQINYQLRKGASGEDVRILQEILASDPSIYPEGLITGFFGPLTETAVKRFQAKIKVEQAGEVGPQTLARINEILAAAGVTGDVPSDLLNSRVKIEIKIKDGKEEVKIEIKEDNSGKGSVGSDDDDDNDGDEDEDDDIDDKDDSDEDEDD